MFYDKIASSPEDAIYIFTVLLLNRISMPVFGNVSSQNQNSLNQSPDFNSDYKNNTDTDTAEKYPNKCKNKLSDGFTCISQIEVMYTKSSKENPEKTSYDFTLGICSGRFGIIHSTDTANGLVRFQTSSTTMTEVTPFSFRCITLYANYRLIIRIRRSTVLTIVHWNPPFMVIIIYYNINKKTGEYFSPVCLCTYIMFYF